MVCLRCWFQVHLIILRNSISEKHGKSVRKLLRICFNYKHTSIRLSEIRKPIAQKLAIPVQLVILPETL